MFEEGFGGLKRDEMLEEGFEGWKMDLEAGRGVGRLGEGYGSGRGSGLNRIGRNSKDRTPGGRQTCKAII